jgi:arylsulfatase A-like enzyme
MTGLYPSEHGAEQRWSKLAPDQITLAEIAREAGYRTLGVSGAVYVTNASGLRQGFEVFDESQALDHLIVSSRAITDRAIDFVRSYGEEPFFLYLHYFDPHWAYIEHEEYDFADGYQGWLRELTQEMKQNEFAQYVGVTRPRPRRHLFDPDELAYLRDLYEEEIAYTDAQVGRLLRHLRETGLEESSLVIVFADHGEEFMERGNLGHGKTVHEELVNVPLVIAEPPRSGQAIVSRPVETRSLFTTILDFMDLQPPSGRELPTSLLDGGSGEAGPVRSATYTLITGEAGRPLPEPLNLWLTSIRDGRWKLIKAHLHDRVMLYDLASDPGERNECSDEYPEQRMRLERELDRIDARVKSNAPSAAAAGPDADQRRKLKALGYL